MLPEELDASFLEVGWDVCWAQCRVVEGDLQFLLELLDVCPAVCVAEHTGEMLDGVGVMVCFVVGGIGGVLWYPVRGLMGLRFWGYVLLGFASIGRQNRRWLRRTGLLRLREEPIKERSAGKMLETWRWMENRHVCVWIDNCYIKQYGTHPAIQDQWQNCTALCVV